MRRVLRAILAATLALIASHRIWAQQPSPLERTVGPDIFGKPLVITKLTGTTVGALAAAARVPMGFEAVTTVNVIAPWRVNASGKTLRAVLDAIVVADPRYEWRDDTGVVVLRPRWASADLEHRLHRLVGAIRAENIQSSDAMQIVGRLFGAQVSPGDGPRDLKRFTVDLPAGTVVDALDGIVRAHGTMAWAFEPTTPTPLAPGSVWLPFTASLIAGDVGTAFGVGVTADSGPLDLLPTEVDPRRPPAGPLLDRIVGTGSNAEPLVLHGASGLRSLADITHAPMGIQLLSQQESPGHARGIAVTGMSLRDALSAFTAADPRYGWREMDGVIVIRPWAAWGDETDPLSQQVQAVRLTRVTLSEVIRVERSLLEPGTNYGAGSSPALDARRFSVDAPRGSQLDLLNAIARSHGSLCWVFDEDERPFFDGRNLRRRRLTFYVAGIGGNGFTFP